MFTVVTKSSVYYCYSEPTVCLMLFLHQLCRVTSDWFTSRHEYARVTYEHGDMETFQQTHVL